MVKIKERKFRLKIKIKDNRKSVIQYKSAERAYDSPLARAIRNQRRGKPLDYRPPEHGRKKK